MGKTFLLAEQLDLFALDRWGASSSFAVIVAPHTEIGTAMVGPLGLGDAKDPATDAMHCLAVSADGEFAACIPVESAASFPWDFIAQTLVSKRSYWSLPDGFGFSMAPGDCLQTWLSADLWMAPYRTSDPVPRPARCLARLMEVSKEEDGVVLTDEERLDLERTSQSALADQITLAVHKVLGALKPQLLEVLFSRPRLSVSVMAKLLSMAREHGGGAVSYVMQALRTEPLPLLDLAAHEWPTEIRGGIRETIFSGRSLPRKLVSLGVSRFAHRMSLRTDGCESAGYSKRKRFWSELSLSGEAWLMLMRLLSGPMGARMEELSEAPEVAERLIHLSVQGTALRQDILAWSLASSAGQVLFRLSCVEHLADAIRDAAGPGEFGGRSDERAFSIALGHAKALERRRGFPLVTEQDPAPDLRFWSEAEFMLLIAKFSGQSVEDFSRILFDAHPGVPPTLPIPVGTKIDPLDSVDAIVDHGGRCVNCLVSRRVALDMVLEGVALYAVLVNGRVEATIALELDGRSSALQVVVREVTGIENAEAPPEVQALAEDLAASWTRGEGLEPWLTYKRACQGWLDPWHARVAVGEASAQDPAH